MTVLVVLVLAEGPKDQPWETTVLWSVAAVGRLGMETWNKGAGLEG